MATSPLLNPPLTIPLWGSDEKRTFERVSDVLDWCGVEQNSWAADIKPTQSQLKSAWDAQSNHYNAIRNHATAYATTAEKLREQPDTAATQQQVRQAQSELNARLQFFADGRAISTAHPYFSHIVAIAESDANAGAALLLACLANGNAQLSNHPQLDAIARVGVVSAHMDSARRKTISTLKAELTNLRKRAEEDVSELRKALDAEAERTVENLSEHQTAVKNRDDLWKNLLGACTEEWLELKKFYDEKLALLAPTEYWRNRVTQHHKMARIYALVFGGSIAILVEVFIIYGIQHLESPGTDSVVLAVLPVLIPAFAAVWVLRILGRLLSESLKIAQDAEERATMVLTFLALMRDETTGKQVVTDEDRKLILHALFRQSTVTATDDSPPLHWIESLRKR